LRVVVRSVTVRQLQHRSGVGESDAGGDLGGFQDACGAAAVAVFGVAVGRGICLHGSSLSWVRS